MLLLLELAFAYCGSIVWPLLIKVDAMGLLSTFQPYLAAFAALATVSTAEISRGVTLPGYGSFVGTTVGETLTKKPLSAPVNAWLGIDYATQPVGEGRFAHVDFPKEFSGTKNATQYGYSCIQDPTALSFPQSEACLNFNVFRPQNVTLDQKLPVFIWIHGVRQTEVIPDYTYADRIRVDSSRALPGALMALLSSPPPRNPLWS